MEWTQNSEMFAGLHQHVSWDVSVGPDEWKKAASRSLEANGFCIIRGASKGVSVPMIASLESAVRARLDMVLKKVVEVGLDPIKDNFSFSEVCKRHSGARYDISAAGSAFGGVYDELVAAVHEAVVSVLPASKVDRGGCVASLPGAPCQGWHIDGQQAGLINAFVPLVDIDETNGTEFIPGSHDPQEIAFVPAAELDPVTPSLSVGDILLFDYRVRHRGLENSRESWRPVIYAVYSCGGATDKHNFPEDVHLFPAPEPETN